MTPEDRCQFREQWQRTTRALDEMQRLELAGLTEEQAWSQIEALLGMVVYYPRQAETSGLVEQQAWFHGKRRS